jgi:outer membrane protein
MNVIGAKARIWTGDKESESKSGSTHAPLGILRTVDLSARSCHGNRPDCDARRRGSAAKMRQNRITIRSIRVLCLLLVAVSRAAVGGETRGADDFSPASWAAPLSTNRYPEDCRPNTSGAPLLLFDAIERALCEDPKTRGAWANIKAASASVGIAKSAYLPSLDASVKYAYQHNSTEVSGDPQLRSNFTKAVNDETLALGWVFYDFGSRSSALQNTRELLLAAQANQNATLQSTFASTAKAYFGAQAANADVLSKRRIESFAQDNVNAAAGRVAKGVAPITDQLQADTALAQAIYERVKAEGELRTAIGVLAVDMSLDADEELTLPEMESETPPDTHFVQAVRDLLDDAKRNHPRVLAAAAQWQAALANVKFARARGLPVFKLVGEADRSSEPVSASLGQPALPAQTRDNYIGVKIEIPFLDGINRTYQIQQAEAQADLQEQGLREAQRQVAIGVWSSVQTLRSDTENLRNTDAVLQSAQRAFNAAQHRYQLGVGNILEILNSQTALSKSEQEKIEAQMEWRNARLQLAASLGTLGMWAVQ